MLRQIFTLGLVVALPACSSVVELDDAEGSTDDAADASSTSGDGTTTSVPTTDPVPTTGTPDPDPDPDPTTGGGDEPSDETDGCNFLGCGGTDSPQPVECNVFEQDCQEGEKCMPWANDGGNAWNATRCVPIAPDAGGLYESCTVEGSGVSGIDTCELGMICWNVDERLQGECYGMCGGAENAPTCEDANATCSVGGDSILPLCVPNCDPLDIEPCSPGEACYPLDSTFVCAPDASGPKLGGTFEPCEFVNACDPGLFCGSADAVAACEGSGCCTPYCDLSDPLCPDPTVCVPFFAEGKVPPGYENVGACVTDPA